MPDFISLHWDQRHICGVEAQVARGRVQVRRGFAWDWPDDLDWKAHPRQAGQWLREQLQSLGLTEGEVLVTLPREETVLRPLELPDAPDDELPALVRFQGAAKSSVPLDQLWLDYVPLPKRPGTPGRSVLMATIPARLAERVRELTTAAGLQLAGIGLSSLAIAELVARSEQSKGTGTEGTLILYRRDNRIELAVLHQHAVLATHSHRLFTETAEQEQQALLAEVTRFLVPVRPQLPDGRIGRLYLIGDELSADVTAALRERLACDVTQLPLRDAVSESQSLPEPSHQFAVPVGALLEQADGLIPGVDFLNPRKPVAKPDRRKLKIGLAAGGVALALAVAYGMVQLEISDLDAQIAQIASDDRELSKVLERGQPVVQASQTIGEWETRGVSALGQMKRITEALPGTEQIYLTNFQLTPSTGNSLGRVIATGYARTRRDVELLNDRLAEMNYRVQPKTINPNQRRDPEYPFQFDLDLEVLPDAAAEPAKGTKTQAVATRGGK